MNPTCTDVETTFLYRNQLDRVDYLADVGRNLFMIIVERVGNLRHGVSAVDLRLQLGRLCVVVNGLK